MIFKFCKYFSIIIFTLLSVACAGNDIGEDILTSTEYLNVTSQIAVAGDGKEKGKLDISADCAWTVSGAPSWMSLSANSGTNNSTIEITCTRNPSSTDERSAVLTVTSASGKIKKAVTVIQAIANEQITTNVNELSFISVGESKTLAIQSNTTWTIKGVEDWFTLSRTEGEGNHDVTITTKKNEQETPRSATLTVQGANASVRVSIMQEGHITSLSVSPSFINADAVASSYALQLEGDAAWNASVNVVWCTLSKLNGVGTEKLTVNTNDNTTPSTRKAIISITTSHGNKLCEVTQQAGKTPSITGISVSDVQRYAFTASASFSSDYDVMEYGICYSEKNMTPTVSDNVAKKDGTGKSGSMSFIIDGLQSGKTYYLRAYAKNIVGIGYSEVETINTLGSTPGSGDNVTPQI